jgi:exodeoxyribonuclease-5
MINNYLEQQIKTNFRYSATLEQEKAVKSLSEFLFSVKSDQIFVLRGYAGTGKTSLVGALVRTLDQLQRRCTLLAPTGRAAKVFSHYAQHPAFTIHKKIYRQKSFSSEMSGFELEPNLQPHTLFIVDEASMIANEGLSGSGFGTGRLLDDLIQYVYSAEGCRLLMVGDTAQLPPIGEEESPALSPEALGGYGLEVTMETLTQVVRQGSETGILWNATALRQRIAELDCFDLPRLKASGFTDVEVMPGGELIEAISECYQRAGMDQTIIITRSNKRANQYNEGIRRTILYREEELESGDWLMVARNNYFWTEGRKDMDFIANGDIAVVRRVRRVREEYGFRFADVVLQFPDYGEEEMEVKVLLDTLHSDAPSLSKEDNDRLFQTILQDYADIPLKRDRMKKMKEDPFYNALQVKYAYAVTCHKAQGGQWQRVFLDQGYLTDDMVNPDYYRWLYTAFTRATEKIYLVNYKEE